ncbi:NUDIX domain-containing protein [Thetidibacter halocola]|uniref:ADP-ribose pyrophosphatase n=1 Tax=Thetidibacter halocola TaxID=2827239 RepID=A0A8J7WCW4_9RHOB|nr:NUDIX domain-containing protein [Thetidibacter halocola]MBS0123056.1 NUDIX domain-containing protein [Thetidibacter halocola]
MSALFFYGTLRYRPLLEIVLRDSAPDLRLTPALLADHAVHWVADQPFPMILPEPGAEAEGLLAEGLTDAAIARLNFYEGGFAYATRAVSVQTAHGAVAAGVFFPQEGLWQAGAPWSLDDWAARWGEITLGAARDVMARHGVQDSAHVMSLLPFLRSRAWARQIAARGAPATRRKAPDPDALQVEPVPGAGYDGFFGLRVFDVRHRRFDGEWSPMVRRESFIAFDAALVLPYDPVTDRLLLIEQLRYGPILRGDPAPWVLEPVAGLVDAGEEPADAARREAMEEAGLALGDLIPMMRGYASPGYSTEFFHCFLALCDLSQVRGGLGGLDAEHEDILSHVLPFDDAMALLDSGEVTAIPLASMLLWLSRWRDRHRASA